MAKYKEAIKRVNAQAAMVEDEGDALGDSTAKLADAGCSRFELQEKKRVIDKHTNIATALLGNIKQRGLDEYYAVEEDLLVGKGDKPSVMSLLQATGRGSAEDKVRLAILAERCRRRRACHRKTRRKSKARCAAGRTSRRCPTSNA